MPRLRRWFAVTLRFLKALRAGLVFWLASGWAKAVAEPPRFYIGLGGLAFGDLRNLFLFPCARQNSALWLRFDQVVADGEAH
jgi:hypothetical protein